MRLHTIVALLALAGSHLLATVTLASPEPGVLFYHVGRENRPVFTAGPYVGQPNPNHNRLVFLLSHTFVDTPNNNHYHRIGFYTLTGPAATPTVGFSSNDNIPEPYQNDDGLALLPGSGPFAGKMISGLGPEQLSNDYIEEEYGDLTIAPSDTLIGFDGMMHPDQAQFPGLFHPVHYLVNTSGGVYKGSVASLPIEMELTAISPGMTIHDTTGAQIFTAGVGDEEALGTGANWTFDPVFAVPAGTAPGTKFAATFVLRDTSGVYGDSAPFTFDFIAVPEPSSVLIAGLGLAAVVAWRRRK